MLLFLEAFIYLGWARILIQFPFSKISSSLGLKMQETKYDHVGVNKVVLANIYNALRIVSKYTFWDSKCLVRAIAGMRMLKRRGIESTLYLGTAKDEKGNFIAHAWLRSGPYYITGEDVMKKFTVVQMFAQHGVIKKGEFNEECSYIK